MTVTPNNHQRKLEWGGKVGASKRCEMRRLLSCSGLATDGTLGTGRRPVGASERVRRADNQVALVVVTRGKRRW